MPVEPAAGIAERDSPLPSVVAGRTMRVIRAERRGGGNPRQILNAILV
jgi:hypothetical protein